MHNSEQAKRIAKALREKYGDDFYSTIGKVGGKATNREGIKKGFSADLERAREAGRKGGLNGRKNNA